MLKIMPAEGHCIQAKHCILAKREGQCTQAEGWPLQGEVICIQAKGEVICVQAKGEVICIQAKGEVICVQAKGEGSLTLTCVHRGSQSSPSPHAPCRNQLPRPVSASAPSEGQSQTQLLGS